MVPAVTYRLTTDGSVTYSLTPSEIDTDKLRVTLIKQGLSDRAIDAMLAAAAEESEVKTDELSSIEDLSEVSSYVEGERSKFQGAEAVRKELAVRLLNDGAKPSAVKEAAQASYHVIKLWCGWKSDKSAKPSELKVKKSVITALDQAAKNEQDA